MIDETFSPQCKLCGDVYNEQRFRLGFAFCLDCGDEIAKAKKFVVEIPYGKGAYQYIHNPKEELKFTNPKRTT
jgi:ribosomal protein L37AE/L43A